ncbi:hypothetical protein D3C77_392980 [compost metagenome]
MLQRLELGGTHIQTRLSALCLDTLQAGFGQAQVDGLFGNGNFLIGQVGQLFDFRCLAILDRGKLRLPQSGKGCLGFQRRQAAGLRLALQRTEMLARLQQASIFRRGAAATEHQSGRRGDKQVFELHKALLIG